MAMSTDNRNTALINRYLTDGSIYFYSKHYKDRDIDEMRCGSEISRTPLFEI